VQNGHAHGNVGIAGGRFAGQILPCVHAQKNLCRAYRRFYRAKCRTATPCFPVVFIFLRAIGSASSDLGVSLVGGKICMGWDCPD
jgi:hypothetical protein